MFYSTVISIICDKKIYKCKIIKGEIDIDILFYYQFVNLRYENPQM